MITCAQKVSTLCKLLAQVSHIMNTTGVRETEQKRTGHVPCGKLICLPSFTRDRSVIVFFYFPCVFQARQLWWMSTQTENQPSSPSFFKNNITPPLSVSVSTHLSQSKHSCILGRSTIPWARTLINAQKQWIVPSAVSRKTRLHDRLLQPNWGQHFQLLVNDFNHLFWQQGEYGQDMHA